MPEKEDRNTPTETGLYWARTSESMLWYDMIVEVGGEPPFLKVVWAYVFSCLQGNPMRKPEEYEVYWGPKIERPEVPKLRIKKR